MADIDKRGGRYIARWRDPAGRQRSRSFGRKLDAARFLTGLQADQQRGAYTDPGAGKVTLAEYATTRWLPAQLHLRPNSVTLYDAHLRNHILRLLGDRPLGSVRRPDCKALVAALSASLAPATVATAYAIFRSVMASAVDDGLIAANPASRVPLPRTEAAPFVLPTAAEVAAVAEAMPARYEVTVWLAAGAGLREGEALGLLAHRTDFLRRHIAVLEQMQNGILCPPKTRASQRVVPVDDFILTRISEHIRGFPPGPDGLLVTSRTGRSVRRNSFGQCWRNAVAGAGLPRGTTFHALRHFYASTLIAAGLNPKEIQVRLGHATITETMDCYGHLFPASSEHGRGAIGAQFTTDHHQEGISNE
jgi:integrase